MGTECPKIDNPLFALTMPVDLPPALAERLSEFEAAGEPLKPIELASQLEAAAGPGDAMTEDQRRGCLAEITSLRFIAANGADREPWGIYFCPMGTAIDAAKTPHHRPDARLIDAEIIEYWKVRAGKCQHAALRARYADLAREIAALWNRDHPDARIAPQLSLSQLAASSYIEAVERGLARDAFAAWQWLERALEIASTVKDKPLIERAKTAAFNFQSAREQAGDRELWWRLPDVMAESKGVAWTEQERAEVCNLLRRRLALASDISSKEFAPHDATGAADRLARWVEAPEKAAALRTAGGAFEAMAAKADAILATTWLEDLSRRYRDAKLDADVNRVDAAIRARAGEAQASMRTMSASIEVTPDEMKKWLDNVIQGSLPEGLARVAFFLMNDPKRMAEELAALASQAPMRAKIQTSIVGPQGFTAAVIGPMETDMPGWVLHRIADAIAGSGTFLHQALGRATETYALDADGWLAYFAGSAFFPADRHAILKMGIDAWLDGDFVKAIHILVPQVEAALRECLIAMGETAMKPVENSGGFESIGMGAILNHPTFAARIPPTVRIHLRALYSDPRGINLRNKLAHGHAGENLLGLGMANWVIHSLITIRAFGMGSAPKAESPPAPTTQDPPQRPTPGGTPA